MRALGAISTKARRRKATVGPTRYRQEAVSDTTVRSTPASSDTDEKAFKEDPLRDAFWRELRCVSLHIRPCPPHTYGRQQELANQVNRQEAGNEQVNTMPVKLIRRRLLAGPIQGQGHGMEPTTFQHAPARGSHVRPADESGIKTLPQPRKRSKSMMQSVHHDRCPTMGGRYAAAGGNRVGTGQIKSSGEKSRSRCNWANERRMGQRRERP